MLNVSSFLQRSFFVALLTPTVTLASQCYPTPDSNRPQYLVGYGSLLYEEARAAKTEKGKVVLPVWVDNHKRGWFVRSKPGSLQHTRLGVAPSDGERFNGILISLPPGKLKYLDRQAYQECRMKIDRAMLSSMNDKNIPENGDIWVYQVQKKYQAGPVGEYQILQSNVDVFLTGCIEQADRFSIKNFADLCMTSTNDWSTQWANDRRRPFDKKIVKTKNRQVNQLLEKHLGSIYDTVKAY